MPAAEEQAPDGQPTLGSVTQLAYRALIENDQIFSSGRDMRVRRAGNRAACLFIHVHYKALGRASIRTLD